MFIKDIENIRKTHELSIPQFCNAAHIQVRQYRRYLKGTQKHLSIRDAVMLMAAFPNELNINRLLGMIGKKDILLHPDFPSFSFVCDLKQNYEKGEKSFINFYIAAAFEFFKPVSAIKLLATMTSNCDKTGIWLPTTENMYYLMHCLREIRRLKYKDFRIPSRTVLSHFLRNRLITRFSDLCEYERLFHSGGLYMISELVYLNEKKDFGIIPCIKKYQ